MTNQFPPYNADDILRYLKGEMSNSDMHRFELAALKDPFLQDAIDGYREAYMNNKLTELLPIKAAVESYEPPLTSQRHQTPIPIWRRKAVQVAVAASLIAGTGWYIYNLSQTKHNLSQETATVKTPVVTNTDSALNNTVAVQPVPEITAPNPSAKKQVLEVQASKAEESTANAVSNSDTATEDAVPASENIARVSQDAEKLPETAAAKSAVAARSARAFSPQAFNLQQDTVATPGVTTVVAGKVTDKEKYPLDNISIQIKGTQTSVLSDELGRFELSAPTGATLVASGPGYKPKEFSVMPGNKKMELELDAAPQSLEEVVVSGYAAIRKRKTNRQIDTTDAAPEGGWKNFETYIQRNKQVTDKAKTPAMVVLSFEVDANGRPAEFDIIESGGAMYNKEAIRLLQEGPTWVNKTKGTSPMAKITIVF